MSTAEWGLRIQARRQATKCPGAALSVQPSMLIVPRAEAGGKRMSLLGAAHAPVPMKFMCHSWPIYTAFRENVIRWFWQQCDCDRLFTVR